MHDSIDFPTGKCAVNRIFRYICSYSPERFCRPETMIHNDYENRISIFIIPVAFRNRLYVKHPPDRQGATLRLDPAAAFAHRADRRRRLQSRRIGSGGRQPRKFRTDTAPVRCAEPVETGLQRRAYRLRTKSVTRFSRSGETGQPEPGHPAARRELRTRTYTRTDRKSTRVRRARTRHRPSHLDLAARTETDGLPTLTTRFAHRFPTRFVIRKITKNCSSASTRLIRPVPKRCGRRTYTRS